MNVLPTEPTDTLPGLTRTEGVEEIRGETTGDGGEGGEAGLAADSLTVRTLTEYRATPDSSISTDIANNTLLFDTSGFPCDFECFLLGTRMTALGMKYFFERSSRATCAKLYQSGKGILTTSRVWIAIENMTATD